MQSVFQTLVPIPSLSHTPSLMLTQEYSLTNKSVKVTHGAHKTGAKVLVWLRKRQTVRAMEVKHPSPKEFKEAEMDHYRKTLVQPIKGKFSPSLPTNLQAGGPAVL